MPLPMAKMTARIFEIMPKPLLTRDQLKLLKYDNIVSGKYKTNSDIGVPSVRHFDEEVKKYPLESVEKELHDLIEDSKGSIRLLSSKYNEIVWL